MKANQFTYNNWKNSVSLPRKKLVGHGTSTHQKVWKPIGKLEGINLAIEDMSQKI
jgi:phenylalanine-4-hydroxylase